MRLCELRVVADVIFASNSMYRSISCLSSSGHLPWFRNEKRIRNETAQETGIAKRTATGIVIGTAAARANMVDAVAAVPEIVTASTAPCTLSAPLDPPDIPADEAQCLLRSPRSLLVRCYGVPQEVQQTS
jgi:hypothetical protein